MFVTVEVDTERVGGEFGTSLQARCLRNRTLTRGYRGDQKFGVRPALTASREEFDELLERVDRSLTETEAATPGLLRGSIDPVLRSTALRWATCSWPPPSSQR